MSNTISAAATGLPKSSRIPISRRKSASAVGAAATEKPLLEVFPGPYRLLPDGIGLSDLPDRYVINLSEDIHWRFEPRLKSGLRCIYSKVDTVCCGDIVLLIYRPEALRSLDCQHSVKHLIAPIPDWVTFPYREQPGDMAWPVLHVERLIGADNFKVRCSDLLSVHKCLGPVPEDVETVETRHWGRSITIRSNPREDFWNARRAAQ